MSTIERERTTTPAPVTTREVLHRAADLLEEFGWCRFHGAEDAAGRIIQCDDLNVDRFCAAGAITRAAIDLGYFDPSHYYRSPGHPSYCLADALTSNGDPDAPSLWEWNDKSGRTKAEVVARLRDLAEAS